MAFCFFFCVSVFFIFAADTCWTFYLLLIDRVAWIHTKELSPQFVFNSDCRCHLTRPASCCRDTTRSQRLIPFPQTPKTKVTQSMYVTSYAYCFYDQLLIDRIPTNASPRHQTKEKTKCHTTSAKGYLFLPFNKAKKIKSQTPSPLP
jgi:hypothetical protein